MKHSNADAQQKKEAGALIDSHLAYQGKRLQLRLDSYQLSGHTKVFEIVHHPGAVMIVPVKDPNHLFFVRQWRRAIQKVILEFPAGTLEPNEDPLFCAQRELQEEIGYKALKLSGLNGFYPSPGFCDEYLHIFIGEDLIESRLAPDDDEGIDVVLLDIQKAWQMIEDGTIQDAKSIIGITRYLEWRKKQ